MRAGCDIAPKASPDGGLTTEWRWSFGNAEKRLLQGLSSNQESNQQRTYFVAKILFYRYLTPVDSDKIHSYWIKTAMFWLAEKYQNSHNIWCDENLVKSVKLFYQELLQMIQDWNLPHFIIPSHSLLRYTDRSLQPFMTERITDMINNIESYIPAPSEFVEVEELLKGSRAIIEGLVSFAHDKKGTFIERMEMIRKIQLFGQMHRN